MADSQHVCRGLFVRLFKFNKRQISSSTEAVVEKTFQIHTDFPPPVISSLLHLDVTGVTKHGKTLKSDICISVCRSVCAHACMVCYIKHASLLVFSHGPLICECVLFIPRCCMLFPLGHFSPCSTHSLYVLLAWKP